ncbi:MULTISPECIES: DUF6117 family protein [Rhizobium]|uniref:DUF6117 family protein n=1 Tax=Rhizobium TaxID=379 RepID=UPI001FF01BEF|nr:MULTISPECIES: DUF6117 family protein [Rhizobium]
MRCDDGDRRCVCTAWHSDQADCDPVCLSPNRSETIHAPKPRYVLCAVGRTDGEYVFTPFGHLANGNPYDAYLPPDPDDPTGLLVSPAT